MTKAGPLPLGSKRWLTAGMVRAPSQDGQLLAWHSGASVDTYWDIRWWFAYRLFSR